MTLQVDFLTSYPREAVVGREYPLEVYIEVTGGVWPYEDEEYKLDCVVGADPASNNPCLGCRSVAPVLVLRKGQKRNGPAQFILTARHAKENALLRVSLVNRAGATVKVLSFRDIRVSAEG